MINYIFITIIATICFFSLLATIHSIVSNIEKRKMIEAFCKIYMTVGVNAKENGMSIDDIIKAVNSKKINNVTK